MNENLVLVVEGFVDAAAEVLGIEFDPEFTLHGRFEVTAMAVQSILARDEPTLAHEAEPPLADEYVDELAEGRRADPGLTSRANLT